jgi:hypothetical protein
MVVRDVSPWLRNNQYRKGYGKESPRFDRDSWNISLIYLSQFGTS